MICFVCILSRLLVSFCEDEGPDACSLEAQAGAAAAAARQQQAAVAVVLARPRQWQAQAAAAQLQQEAERAAAAAVAAQVEQQRAAGAAAQWKREAAAAVAAVAVARWEQRRTAAAAARQRRAAEAAARRTVVAERKQRRAEAVVAQQKEEAEAAAVTRTTLWPIPLPRRQRTWPPPLLSVGTDDPANEPKPKCHSVGDGRVTQSTAPPRPASPQHVSLCWRVASAILLSGVVHIGGCFPRRPRHQRP